jgi:hypothetical protein
MDNLVLITSIIKTPNKPLSYAIRRSIYTHEERFEQTKVTINSIREKIPNSKILIVECSDLNKEENDYFINNSDYFINLYGSEDLRENIHSISKSLGEGTMTIIALKYIIGNNISFNNLFKISGRYWLSDNFNYDNFNNDKIVIKYINNHYAIRICTALYKIPYRYISLLESFLIQNIYKLHNCIEYETLFSDFINMANDTDIISHNIIGISGNISVVNEFYNG